jgi:hypothetical protein
MGLLLFERSETDAVLGAFLHRTKEMQNIQQQGFPRGHPP